MAYDTKKLIKDADKSPVPQYYNKTADVYEAAEGSDGALHMKLTGSNLQENPYGTKQGQSAVSVAETFWTRLGREGILVAGYKQDFAITDTITAAQSVLEVGIGRRLYISRLIFSSNVDARGVVKVDFMKYYKQEGAGATTLSETFWMPFYVKAMGTVELKFDGDFWIEEGMTLNLRGQTLTAGATGKMDFFGMGWEVAVGA